MKEQNFFQKGELYNAPKAEFIEIDSGQSTLLYGSLGFGFGDGFGDEIPLF